MLFRSKDVQFSVLEVQRLAATAGAATERAAAGAAQTAVFARVRRLMRGDDNAFFTFRRERHCAARRAEVCGPTPVPRAEICPCADTREYITER